MSFNPHLQRGREISNNELVGVFKCGLRGGMRRSKKSNSLVIVSDHTKSYYKDRWENNVFHYTGMGLIGNQQLTFAQNKTLNESDTNGVNLHLFEVFDEGRYVYQGQVKLAGNPYKDTQPDFKGDMREVWVFPLRLVGKSLPAVVSEETFHREQERREKGVRKLSDKELSTRIPLKKKVVSQKFMASRFARNEYVNELARRSSNGKCQLCGQPAPFIDRNNVPYLEVHHVKWLSEGGEDMPRNAVALCPNCHRKMHILNLQSDRKHLSDVAERNAPTN